MFPSVLILGGGSAGFLAALSLKAKLPALPVRVVRSPGIGIIGVGEGSTADLPKHLHGFAGLDVTQFHREVRPTYKLGVHFLWGPRESFDYTFTRLLKQQHPQLPRVHGYYCWEDFGALEMNSALMAAGKAFARQPNGAPDLQRNVAYHIENAEFVAYLERRARERGVAITDATVVEVERNADGVAALKLDTGERAAADWFLDCSGFRSELIGQALGEPFLSYSDTLFCDRAVAGGWERTNEPLLPYTTTETMDAGWAWQIEHDHHVNRGYVYSSSGISDDEAEAEFRRRNPKVQQTRLVKFRTGRYARGWVGNVIGVGNSAGFVEPLEATALLIICHAARFFTVMMEDSGGRPTPSQRDAWNRVMNSLWDEIRDFLAIHYRFNTRVDTPFWKHCREAVALHGAEPIVQHYRENGPSFASELGVLNPEASIFQLDGFYALLMGQQVPHARIAEAPAGERGIFEAMQQTYRLRAQHGCDLRESLDLMRGPRWMWTPGFYEP
jgi:tryptophan halogenase